MSLGMRLVESLNRSSTYFTKINVAFLSISCIDELLPNEFLCFRHISGGCMNKSNCMEGRLGASPAEDITFEGWV